MLSCPYKESLGIDCPGCGLQRAFVALLRGDVAESLVMYPALLPMLFMFLLLGLHLKFHFRHGALALKLLFLFNALLIFGSWLVKLVQHTH